MNICKRIIAEIMMCLQWMIDNCPGTIGAYMRIGALRMRSNVIIGEKGSIGLNTSLTGSGSIRGGTSIHIRNLCHIHVERGGSLIMGDRISMSRNVYIAVGANEKVIIGNDVLIGPNVVIRSGDHRADVESQVIREQGHIHGTIEIQDDVWIGANAVITRDVIIEKHSIIAAGAVVVDRVESGTIVGGVPARIIKKRNVFHHTSSETEKRK